MRWLMIFMVNIVAFAYQFDCTRSCKEVCGKDYVCQIECHTCCPLEDVQRKLDCRMCKGYWFLESCHLARAGQINLKPYIYSFGANPQKGIVAFTTMLQCKAIDPDGVVVQYEWDLNNDEVADRKTTQDSIVLTIDDIGKKTIGCRVKDNSGAFSDWNTTSVEGEYGLLLQKGWNLVSLPTANPIALSSLPDIVIVWKYHDGVWEYYTTDTNLSNKLSNLGYRTTVTSLEPKSGYWIYASRDFAIPCSGSSYTLDVASLQQKRWYLLGSSHTIAATQMSRYSNIQIWWKWKGVWYGWSKDASLRNALQKYHFSFIDAITPSEGFWVKTR